MNEGCIVNKDHSECFVDGLECAQRVCRPRFSEKRGADHYLSPKSQINSQHSFSVKECQLCCYLTIKLADCTLKSACTKHRD